MAHPHRGVEKLLYISWLPKMPEQGPSQSGSRLRCPATRGRATKAKVRSLPHPDGKAAKGVYHELILLV